MVNNTKQHHKVNIAGVERSLPLLEVAPGVNIAVLNILGDTQLVEASGKALAEKLESLACEIVMTAEAKSIALTHAVAAALGKPYVVLRKTYKPYMGETLSAQTLSITTGKPQTLYLDAKDRETMNGARVAIIDDVVSTGSTLESIRKLAELAGAQVTAEAAIFTEGDREKWRNIISLGHLPIFESGKVQDVSD